MSEEIGDAEALKILAAAWDFLGSVLLGSITVIALGLGLFTFVFIISAAWHSGGK